jgi:adenosylmethionine-8-amino-7-oxononanoate aminotransferase
MFSILLATNASLESARLGPDHAVMTDALIVPPSSNAALAARDLKVLWHPCTQMHDHESIPMVPVVRGEGAWLFDADGRRYLDCVSSWWTNLFGHANPRIGGAVKAQLDMLEHVIFAGFTHEPAVELAE